MPHRFSFVVNTLQNVNASAALLPHMYISYNIRKFLSPIIPKSLIQQEGDQLREAALQGVDIKSNPAVIRQNSF